MRRALRTFAARTAMVTGGLALLACSNAREAPRGAPHARLDAGETDSAKGAPPRDAATGAHPEPSEASRMNDARALEDARAAVDAMPPSPARDSAAPSSTDAGPEDAGSSLVCHGPGARYATGSPAHSFGPGQNDGQASFPALVLGPPKGGGDCNGSTDVVSLGNGGYVVVEFTGNAIVDGPGPDFIVFENPFGIGCNTANVFAELGTVAVSDDLVNWTDFPCTATAAPYGECSGWRIVYANPDTNDIDPTDPATAGGDPYDLADIGVKSARYVRVTDRPDLTGMAGVYDLDAVAITHPACP